MAGWLGSFSLAVMLTCPNCASDDAAASYSQTYAILIDGSPAGTESVVERTNKDGSIVSDSSHEILVSDGTETKRMAFTTRTVLQKGTWSPVQYSCRYSSGESRDFYEVSIRKRQVHRTLTRFGRTSEANLPLHPGLVIVDFNVYHHYDYLIRRYDLKKGSRQSFQNFVPLLAAEVALALTRLADTTLESVQKSVPVQNFRVEFAGSWAGVVSFDKSWRLVRLLLTEKGLTVIRKDLLPE